MKKVVVVDIDGTLVDTQAGIYEAINSVLVHYNKTPIKMSELNQFIGPPIKESFVSLCDFEEERIGEAVDLYRHNYVSKYIYNSQLYEGWDKILQELKKRDYILGIATLKTEKQSIKLLEYLGLYRMFDIVQSAREDGSLRKQDMLKYIREKYQSECDEFYMIGDTMGDYYASVENNYRFIFAEYGYGDMKGGLNCLAIESPLDLFSFLSI